MKTIFPTRTGLIFVFLATAVLFPLHSSGAENPVDALELVRSTYATDRQAFLTQHMQLSESDGAKFWPLYRQYRAATEVLGDELVKLVLEYAEVYPSLQEDQAQKLLKRYTKLEEKLAQQRTWYLKKFAKILPATKALRFAQLENRMDLGLRLQLASAIPLAGNKAP